MPLRKGSRVCITRPGSDDDGRSGVVVRKYNGTVVTGWEVLLDGDPEGYSGLYLACEVEEEKESEGDS